MIIPFTQYLRPDGRRAEVEIDRPDDVALTALLFIKSGGRFDCEHLTTGDVSLTAVYNDYVIAHEVVVNGPEVPAAVDRLIARAFLWLRKLPIVLNRREKP